MQARAMKIHVTSRLIIAATGATIALIATGAVVMGRLGSEQRDPSPTREQILEDLPHIREALDRGEDVTIYEADPPDPDATPVLHGPFRLVPARYAGSLEYDSETDFAGDPGPITDDFTEALKSTLFLEPGFMPKGFELVDARSPAGAEPINIGLETVYRTKDGEEIVIRREVAYRIPIDIIVDESSPVISVKPTELTDGRPGLIFGWRSVADQVERGMPSGQTIPPANGFRMVMAYDSDSNIVSAVEVKGSPSVSDADLLAILESLK